MKTLLITLALVTGTALAAYLLHRFLWAVHAGFEGYRTRQRIAAGDIEATSQQIARLIAKVDTDDHGRLFSRVGSHLVDLQCYHVAGACYRIGLEIYPERGPDVPEPPPPAYIGTPQVGGFNLPERPFVKAVRKRNTPK